MQVNEIFDSLSGEQDGFGGQGKPTTFIRLQGCNFWPQHCSYCDSLPAASSKDSTEMTIDEILERINMPKVIITGGEPLAQYNDVAELVRQLLGMNIPISIETNGSLVVPHDFPGILYLQGKAERLRIVMDYKLLSSGMSKFMDPKAFESLSSMDVIKFVIGDDVDYARMKELLANNSWVAQIAISPVLSAQNRRRPGAFLESLDVARELAQKMLNDPDLHAAQFNLQIHKLLGVK